MPGLALAIAETMPGTGSLDSNSLTHFDENSSKHLPWILFYENSITEYNINSSCRMTKKINAQVKYFIFRERRISEICANLSWALYIFNTVRILDFTWSARKIKRWTSSKMRNVQAVYINTADDLQ